LQYVVAVRCCSMLLQCGVAVWLLPRKVCCCSMLLQCTVAVLRCSVVLQCVEEVCCSVSLHHVCCSISRTLSHLRYRRIASVTRWAHQPSLANTELAGEKSFWSALQLGTPEWPHFEPARRETVLQCLAVSFVAVCCSVSRTFLHARVLCTSRICVAVSFSVLQCLALAVCCSVLQCLALCYSCSV